MLSAGGGGGAAPEAAAIALSTLPLSQEHVRSLVDAGAIQLLVDQLYANTNAAGHAAAAVAASALASLAGRTGPGQFANPDECCELIEAAGALVPLLVLMGR